MVHQYHGIQGGMKQYVLYMYILEIYFAMNKKWSFRKLCSETLLGFYLAWDDLEIRIEFQTAKKILSNLTHDLPIFF